MDGWMYGRTDKWRQTFRQTDIDRALGRAYGQRDKNKSQLILY